MPYDIENDIWYDEPPPEITPLDPTTGEREVKFTSLDFALARDVIGQYAKRGEPIPPEYSQYSFIILRMLNYMLEQDGKRWAGDKMLSVFDYLPYRKY